MSDEKQLTLPERAAVALGTPKYEQEIRELVAKTVTITEVKNKDGRDQCHGAMMTLKTTRVAIEKAAKAAREDATAFSKAVIAEEKRLVALAEPEETRLQGLRDAWDAEREREKAAKLAAEQARVAAIRSRIDVFRNAPAEMVGKSAQQIGVCADRLSESVIDLTTYAEFAGEAQVERNHAVKRLREMQAAQGSHEAEQARLAAERAQIERERAEAAGRERIAAAARAEQEHKERAALAEIARRDEEVRKALAEERRLQEEAARRTADAMSEISGIQQQVAIAISGRLGVRKGGTIECIRDTLAETEAWHIDQERFGMLAGAAEMAKATAVAEIRRLLAEAEERVAAEAKAAADKLEADHAEALAENQRIDAERAAEQERIRREVKEFANNGPGDAEIVRTLAKFYDVTIGDVMQWMKKFDYAAADEYFAAANVAANRLEKVA